MPTEARKQRIIQHSERQPSTRKPHSKMKGGTDRSFNCQRAVARSEALIHERVEILAERLLAQQLTALWREECAEAACIMRSRRGHLDAATNGRRDRIIPSSA